MQNDPLGDFFKHLHDLHTKQRELAAIWLSKPLVCGSGKTMRIAPEEIVRAENGQLVDITEDKPATHKVILCMGTLYSNFEMCLLELDTNQPLTIKL